MDMRKRMVKTAAILILEDVVDLLKKEKFDSVEEYLMFSPAGDGMGTDKYFIDFSECFGDDRSKNHYGRDLNDVVEYLKSKEV
jgi:hypothetical protein